MSQTRVSDSAPVKNRLFPASAQAKSARCVDSGYSFMKFVVGCFEYLGGIALINKYYS